MKTLEELRKEIDGIDKEIISLLDRRFDICMEVGAVKAQTGKLVLDRSREQQIYDKIKSGTAIKYTQQIINVYAEIMSNSKNLQSAIKADNGQNNKR